VEGMISVIGGKLTTAASLARKCAKALGIRPSPVSKALVPITSANGIETTVRQWASAMARYTGVPPTLAQQTASLYGPSALAILRIAASDEKMMKPLCPHTQHVVAEAVHALRSEHAVMLADILLRRVPVALGAYWSSECTRAAAKSIGATVGWDEEEIEWQIETAELERTAFLRKPAAAALPREASPAAHRLA